MKRCINIPGWFLALIAVFALLKLWLVSDLSIVAIGAAGHDDRLFLNLAVNLLRGEWLGPYNVLTLAKGPFYSMWIAFLFVAGFPLLIAQQVLYILATLFFVITVRPLFRRLLPLAVLYVVVLFNPMTYTWHCLRVVREGIYPALSIFLLAGAIAIMLRVDDRRARYLSISIATGFLLSAFWLTREEGLWIVPSLLILIIWTLVKSIKQKNTLRRLIACSLPLLVLILSLGIVATLNLYYYGIFTIVEFKARPFLDAYGALCRIKPVHWIPDVPVPRETRIRLYRLSPAFAELEPFLEGDIGRGWVRKYNDEIPGGWFMWALRDTVAAAGYATTGAKAMSFYQQMAEQINGACDEGRIDCFARRSSMAPPWRAEYNRPFFQTFISGMYSAATYQDFSAGPGQSQGHDKLHVLFRDLTRSPVYPSRLDRYEASGWIFSENPSAVIQLVRPGKEGSAVSELETTVSPDVERFFSQQGKRFPKAGRARFEITDLDPSQTSLLVQHRGQILARIPLDGSMNERSENGVYFHLDYLRKFESLPEQTQLSEVKRHILIFIGEGYQFALGWLAIAGAAVYIFSFFQSCRKKKFSDGFIIATALLGAVVMRILVLSLISITSFPAIDVLYISPAYPLLLLFVALTLSYEPIVDNASLMLDIQHTQEEAGKDHLDSKA
jgi:hypothetical protein